MNKVLIFCLLSAGLTSTLGCGDAQANEGGQGNGGGLSYQEFSFTCPETAERNGRHEYVIAEDLAQPKGMTVMIQRHNEQWIKTGLHGDGTTDSGLKLRFQDGTLSLYGDGCNQSGLPNIGANILLFY